MPLKLSLLRSPPSDLTSHRIVLITLYLSKFYFDFSNANQEQTFLGFLVHSSYVGLHIEIMHLKDEVDQGW